MDFEPFDAPDLPKAVKRAPPEMSEVSDLTDLDDLEHLVVSVGAEPIRGPARKLVLSHLKPDEATTRRYDMSPEAFKEWTSQPLGKHELLAFSFQKVASRFERKLHSIRAQMEIVRCSITLKERELNAIQTAMLLKETELLDIRD
jgi:hypothetical protein